MGGTADRPYYQTGESSYLLANRPTHAMDEPAAADRERAKEIGELRIHSDAG